MAKSARWRVLEDRLWDDEGRVWHGVRGEWLEKAQVDVIARAAQVAVVHRPHGAPTILRGADVRQYWKENERFLEVPGQRPASSERSSDGAVIAAHVWRRDGAQIIGFLETC